jgi:hypothetical protein
MKLKLINIHHFASPAVPEVQFTDPVGVVYPDQNGVWIDGAVPPAPTIIPPVPAKPLTFL